MAVSGDNDRLIRRLRKKLRQIENLEILRRDLNEEELVKVDKKNDLRLELNNLLGALPSVIFPDSKEVDGFTLLNASDDPLDEMKRKSTEPSENLHENKKQCPPQGPSESTEVVNVVTESAEPSRSSNKIVQTRAEIPEPSQNPPPIVESHVTSSSSRTKEAERQKERQKERQRKKQSLLTSWRGSVWKVIELEGHEDLVVDCDLGSDLAVTASRDTTVKVWSLASGELVLSLRGHTGPVTGVRLLNMEDSQALGTVLW